MAAHIPCDGLRIAPSGHSPYIHCFLEPFPPFDLRALFPFLHVSEECRDTPFRFRKLNGLVHLFNWNVALAHGLPDPEREGEAGIDMTADKRGRVFHAAAVKADSYIVIIINTEIGVGHARP